MIGFVRRHAYALVLANLLTLVLVVGGFVLIVALPDLLARADGAPSSPTPSASPEFMSWFGMPLEAECAGCHVTNAGAVGLRPVPAIAHPLEGWSACNECHASDRLVATAPGHSGLHAPDCVLCHQPGELPAPLSRPHRELQNQDCLACHGSTASLPSDMAHRTQAVCWLCHRQPEQPPPEPRHEVFAAQSDCLTCHVVGSVGALPADHLARGGAECLLCHAPRPSPSAPPSPSGPAP